MDAPTLRYKIAVYTDEHLRWFAEIETITDKGTTCASECTSTAETCRQALELAAKRIIEKRIGAPQGGTGTPPRQRQPEMPSDLPGTHC